jgi:AbiTii-like protein
VSTLLDDIISLASDGKQPLPDILRKCLILAHELKNDRLKAWANQELNGYKSGKDLPEYRVMPAQASGNFIGPFHQQYNDHIIPPAILEKEHQGYARTAYLTQSVSGYQDVVDGAPARDRNLILNWPANMVAYYQKKLMSGGFICHDAWQELPINAIVELLDTVRNITLNMALGIKDELGTSYTDLRRIEPQEAKKVDSIIIQTTGGNTNVAFGNASVDASGQTVIIARDRHALDSVLTKAGLDQSDLDSLTEAIKADGQEKPGTTVMEWVRAKSSKVVSGGMKVGVSIGQQLLTEWLLRHYGLKT